MWETPNSRVTILCTPTRQPKKDQQHDDHRSYFPLYALPVNLGEKIFASVLVLQHVENNFIEELYKTREKYADKYIRIAYSASGLHMVEGDSREDANKGGILTTRIDASRHDDTLPPRDFRNVLQSRPGHNHIPGLLDKLVSPSEILDLRTVSQGKRMYAERHMDVADDFREERFVDEMIHDRSRNLLDSSFVHGVVPPETDDLKQVLQEMKVMVENIALDRNGRSGEFYGRGQVKVYENDDLQSFIEENTATHKNEGKDSFRESSRLPRDAETLGGTRMRESFRDELSSGRDLYAPDVWGKLFQLVKDSALLEHDLDSKTNIRDERRKVMFADIQDMRSSDADLHGSGPGRSFDDAELSRRKPRTDDIASGIQTDVRGINIRAGGWKARDDIPNTESIHDSFSMFDAYLSNVKSLIEDFQHSRKGKPEFNQSFPNAGTKNERRALSPNSILQVMGDIRRENLYRDDKPHYFSEGDKSSKAEWFAFNERRAEDGIAERNRVTFEPEDNRMFGETDRNRTHIDGSERNRIVGESVSERRIFGRPERTGESVDGPDDRNRNMFVRAEGRKWQVLETKDRNTQVFSEPNRNSLMFGGSENRKRPLYDDVEDRNRSVYGELENRKRQMHDNRDNRNRQMYGEPDDRKRQLYFETDVRQKSLYAERDDRKKLMYGEPGDQKRSVYVEPEDLKRFLYDEPGDLTRSAYDEPEGRKRSLYGESEDGSGYMFSRTDDRNLQVTERSRPIVEEVGWNRPTAEEIERNRLIAGERERRVLFGGRTDLIRSGSKAEDGDREASKRHHQHQQQQHSPLPSPSLSPQLPPPLLTVEQIVEVQSTKEKRRKRRAELRKARKIVAKAREAQQGVGILAMQTGGISVAKGKDDMTDVEESSVKKNDGNNVNVGDISLEKDLQTYCAVDRSCEPAASHQTPSSSNIEWDKVQSSGGHSSTASWTSSGGQEGRQRETQEQHGTFRSLQPVDTKQLPPLSSQHVGKCGTSDEPERSMLPSLSTCGQSPQNYGHSYQQYGLSGSIPAQPSAVGMGNTSQYGSWQGEGSGGWNTLSSRSTTGGWGTPGTGNTSNNWSYQSDNASYTWR